MLIDTHAHLGGSDTDAESIIADMEKDGLSRIMAVSYDLESSKRSAAIARENSNVYCAVGIHPNDSQKLDSDPCETLFELASDKANKVVAIGEIGLDYHYDGTDRAVQKYWMERQIILANSLKLPPVFHIRDAYEDMFEVMEKNSKYLTNGGIMHCYSGSKETTTTLSRKYDFYFSFSGVITFKNAWKYPEIIRNLPLDRLLIETDCPYMTPEPYRGIPNKPSYVRYTAARLAEILGMTFDEVEKLTAENAIRLLGLDLK